MRTPVCEMLGIDQPIVQAPMAAIPRLAAAVSNAGALGMVTLTWSDDAGAVVRETAGLTARPFGGNLVLTEDQHHRLAGPSRPACGSSRLCGGSQRLHRAGARRRRDRHAYGRQRRGSTAGGRVRRGRGCRAGLEARRARVGDGRDTAGGARRGGRGGAGAGDRGGGISDARGVAAVLALGAQAAWLGTRFLLAEEMPIHEDYRRRLIAAAETDPQLYANLYEVGWPDSPHRALRNSTATAWEAAGRPPLAQRPGAGEVIAHFASGEAIVRYEPAPPMAGTTGEIEALSMWAGQGVALARQSQSAADIVTELTSRL